MIPLFLPDVNSQGDYEGQPRNTHPTEDDTGDSHSFPNDLERVPADLLQGQISQEKGCD